MKIKPLITKKIELVRERVSWDEAEEKEKEKEEEEEEEEKEETEIMTAERVRKIDEKSVIVRTISVDLSEWRQGGHARDTMT